jgi:regulator of replication initiation timing
LGGTRRKLVEQVSRFADRNSRLEEENQQLRAQLTGRERSEPQPAEDNSQPQQPTREELQQQYEAGLRTLEAEASWPYRLELARLNIRTSKRL